MTNLLDAHCIGTVKEQVTIRLLTNYCTIGKNMKIGVSLTANPLSSLELETSHDVAILMYGSVACAIKRCGLAIPCQA